MKNILAIIIIIIPSVLFGQAEYKKSFPLNGAEKISMYFKWPDVVTIKYHDGNEVLIEGNVSINYGKYDDKFKITSSIEGGILKIQSEVEDMDMMDRITIVKEKNGESYSSGSGFTIISGDDKETVSRGIMMDIFLTVYLPKSVPTVIESKFGLIEIKEIEGPLVADSKFGGVDISIDHNKNLELKAGTVFGEIYTDLPNDFKGDGELAKIGKWHRVNSTFGRGGVAVQVESKFGNIYLRKFK